MRILLVSIKLIKGTIRVSRMNNLLFDRMREIRMKDKPSIWKN